MDQSGRPLSPFLIYRWGITNTLSILHRITGVGLSLGIPVFACWLLAVAAGPEPYASAVSLFGTVWGKLPLAAWAFCFFYHLANGVRHLVWDAGRGFGDASINLGGVAVVLFAIVMTAIYVMIGLV